MTTSLGDLSSKIARELDRADDIEDISAAICETLEDLMRRDLWPLDTRRARLTTKCGQRWYQVLDDSLSAIGGDMGCEPLSEICDPMVAGKVRNFVDVDNVEMMLPKCGCGKCNFPPDTCLLCPVGKDEFMCLPNCTGRPTHVCFDGSAIGLWPVPSCSWMLSICGNFKFPKPKNDGDTHPLLCDATELVKRGAKWRFMLDLDGDDQGALAQKLLYQEQIELLEAEKRKKQRTGRIRGNC